MGCWWLSTISSWSRTQLHRRSSQSDCEVEAVAGVFRFLRLMLKNWTVLASEVTRRTPYTATRRRQRSQKCDLFCAYVGWILWWFCPSLIGFSRFNLVRGCACVCSSRLTVLKQFVAFDAREAAPRSVASFPWDDVDTLIGRLACT